MQVVALYAIDPDGSDLVQLTEGDSAHPAWSPDGTRIAFDKLEPDGSGQIATIAADASDLQVLTSGLGVSEAPSWSPDGTWIAYDCAPTLPTDDSWHTSLCRMNADGSDPGLLGEPDTFDTEPRISPDGTNVVFLRWASDADGWHTTLMVRDLQSGDERAIPAVAHAIEHPAWSPDGQWIMYNVASYMTDAVPKDQLERIAADGSGEPEVLFAATATGGPSSRRSRQTVTASSSAASARTATKPCVCPMPTVGTSRSSSTNPGSTRTTSARASLPRRRRGPTWAYRGPAARRERTTAPVGRSRAGHPTSVTKVARLGRARSRLRGPRTPMPAPEGTPGQRPARRQPEDEWPQPAPSTNRWCTRPPASKDRGDRPTGDDEWPSSRRAGEPRAAVAAITSQSLHEGA